MYDVIIIGAGAAGLMCGIESGKRGRRTLILDHSVKIGEKIRISGGGRCNFTNIHASPEHFISDNPRFCISALKRFRPQDFLALIDKYAIAYHEKTLGQLFCDGSSQQVLDMLLSECNSAGVTIQNGTEVRAASKEGAVFSVKTSQGDYTAASLVIATGGKSIPKIGATGFGYDIARQFGLTLVEPRPGLVPFLLDDALLAKTLALAGVAAEVVASCGKKQFREAMLFTHRGLSGPAILQISSYWREGEKISINFAPDKDIHAWFTAQKQAKPKQEPQSVLSEILPKRLAQFLCAQSGVHGRLADLSNQSIKALSETVSRWQVSPAGTEGYRTAEVTLGGVDTAELSSQSFESKKLPGLFFIGEVVDVTGHLGGFNFQWAWASGFAAGQVA